MGLIPPESVAQVLDRSDIVEVISTYIPLKRAGRNFRALCPFHGEKTPSFMVNPQKQIFHCFGCGQGGNVVSFVMLQERMDFPEAVRLLAQKAGIVIPEESPEKALVYKSRQELYGVHELAVQYFQEILLKSKDAAVKHVRDYLKKRGVDLEIVKQFRLGFALDQWDGLLLFLKSKGVDLKLVQRSGLIIQRENSEGYYDRFRDRIIFPIFDAKGQCVAFGGRTLKDGLAKYLNSPETEIYTKGQQLYGLHLAKDAIVKEDAVYVVEGYMDMIMPYQSGVQNIVASLGTALTPVQIRLLKRYTNNVVMLFDADQAGQSAIVRSLDLLIEQDVQVKVATLAIGEDPDSYIRKYGADAFKECLGKAQTVYQFKLDWLRSQYDAQTIEERAQICDQMLATIGKFQNEVVKFSYLQQLSYDLKIPVDVLTKEQKKTMPTAVKEDKDQQRVQKPLRSFVKTVEYHLLSLFLDDPSWVKEAKQHIDPRDIEDGTYQKIFRTVWDLEEEQEIQAAHLLNRFDDEETRSIISSVLAEESFSVDKVKMFSDCVKRVKDNRLKSERQKIREEIRQAQQQGDRQKLEELTVRFNELLKT